MALKVKAVERLLKFDKESAGKYRYVMKPEMYSTLTQAKVIKEAALRSGVRQRREPGRDEGLLGCSWRGDQGVGYRRPQRGSARTGHHALRTAL